MTLWEKSVIKGRIVEWNDETQKYDKYLLMFDNLNPGDSIEVPLLICKGCNLILYSFDDVNDERNDAKIQII